MIDSTLIKTQDNFGVSKNIYYIYFNQQKRFNFGYLMFVPNDLIDFSRLIVEVDTSEISSNKGFIKPAIEIIDMNNSIIEQANIPIIVPIIPCVSEKGDHYQQLSEECFSLNANHKYYRVDLQLIEMIKDAKLRIKQLTGKELSDKIILKGYSASGIFAQRFALLHPELVDSLCVGESANFFPIPLSETNGTILKYPIGVSDIEQYIGRKFNEDEFSKINFFCYIINDFSFDQNLANRDLVSILNNPISETDENQSLKKFYEIMRIYQELGYQFFGKVFDEKNTDRISNQYWVSSITRPLMSNFLISGNISEQISSQMNL